MDSQWCTEISAWAEGNQNYSQSAHFSFPAESAILQIALSSRSDTDAGAFPAFAYAYFTDYTTSDGTDHDPSTENDQPSYFVSSFLADNFTGFTAFLGVRSCFAQAVINVFVWPSVSE